VSAAAGAGTIPAPPRPARLGHRLEAALVRAGIAWARSSPWPRCHAIGERLGELAHGLRLRRAVASAQLAAAFPERAALEREAILAAHYRELGRVWTEYAWMPELLRRPAGEVVAAPRGIEHLEALRGRGVILLTGHYGNFELLGAWLGRLNPVDFVVKPLSNPRVEAMLQARRRAAGVGTIPLGMSLRAVSRALRDGRWVAMLADQDARRHGVFVPFLGRPASTPVGPARLSIASGAPIVMGFCERCADGRIELDVMPPMTARDPRAADAALELTARHTARLEERVRRRPEMWFWLHRRWKTAPPSTGGGA
jgi:KDO2-lipid IV(A) lauroyltransferase